MEAYNLNCFFFKKKKKNSQLLFCLNLSQILHVFQLLGGDGDEEDGADMDLMVDIIET
jgi:hypothetical protein